MKNLNPDNKDNYIEINTSTKHKDIPQNFISNTSTKHKHIPQNFISNKVDIKKLLNRVKIKERNKKKENLFYLSMATILVSFVAFFSII